MEELSRREVRELARLTEPLTEGQQVFFQSAYWRLRRNPTTALVLCLLLGNFGAHYFYFGRYRGAVLRLLFCWTLIPWVAALFEARTIGSRAMRYNASLASELLVALKGAADEAAPSKRVAAAVPAATALAEARPAAQPAVIPVAADETPAPTPLPRVAEIVGMGAIAAAVAGIARQADEGAASDAADAPAVAPVVAPAMPAASSSVDEHGSEHEDRLIAAAWQGRELPGEEPVEAVEPVTPAEPAREPVAFTDAQLAPTTSLRGLAAPITVPLVPVETLQPAEPAPAVARAPETHLLARLRPFEAAEEETLADAGPDAADGATTDHDPLWLSGAYLGVTTALQRAAASWDRTPAPAREDEEPEQTQELAHAAEEAPTDAAYVDATETFAAPRPAAPDGRWEPDAGGATGGWYSPLDDATSEVEMGEGEPAFSYHMATLPRREAVRMGPPPLVPSDDEEPPLGVEAFGSDTLELGHAQEHEVPHLMPAKDAAAPDISLLGPALASGLADLLRERPARTRPRTSDEGTLATDAALFAPVAPLAIVGSRPEDVDVDDAAGPVWDVPDMGGATLDDDDLPPLAPAIIPQELQQAINGIRESTSMAPTAAYVTTPSQHLRRRVVQRVIVRKMAVLDGRVVAESTVERQVQVVDDGEEMAERIHDATNQAAREALQHLIAQAPEEALPAIRMQLYALDNASSVSRFQGNGVLNSPRR